MFRMLSSKLSDSHAHGAPASPATPALAARAASQQPRASLSRQIGFSLTKRDSESALRCCDDAILCFAEIGTGMQPSRQAPKAKQIKKVRWKHDEGARVGRS